MLGIEIKNLKGIKDLKLNLPFKQGLFVICGENGVGKSTLFSVLAKLVYKGALTNYFKKDGGPETKITFTLNNKKEVWSKPLNWVKSSVNNEGDDIFINGFFEGSLIYGNRFTDAYKEMLGKINKVRKDEDALKNADNFVIENLGYILRNNKDYYKDLKVIKSKTKAKDLGFKNPIYFWNKDDKLISHMHMSSGEFLLVNLISFIDERIKYNNKKKINNLSLILLDEIELALHPSAQNRLAEFLKKISKDYNFCIYFATHSIQIISKINPSSIFYIRQLSNEIDVINPCYPAYATRDIYYPNGFDFIILVEDSLAQSLVDKAIKNKPLDKKDHFYKLIEIIPCGGWEKVLELHYAFESSRIVGESCKIISILDGDIQDSFNEKYSGNSKFQRLKKNFLPIPSIEKYLKRKLIDEFDKDFCDILNARFFHVESIFEILKKYETEYNKDNNGKKLFKTLLSCSSTADSQNEKFLKDIVSTIVEYEDISKFSQKIDEMLQ